MMGAVLFLALLLAGPDAAAAPPDPELAGSVEAYIAPYAAFRAFSGVILVAKRDSILLEKA